MEPLTPIPTPASQRWREFRIQALPVITFIAVVACIAVLWQRYVYPSNIVAQVEAISANVLTTMPGTIQSIEVTRYQKVKKGDPVAVITIAETNFVVASLEAAQADIEVMRARMDMDQVRTSQVYERERLTYLEQKVKLDTLRVNLKVAEAEFRIQEELFTNSFSYNGVATNAPLVNSNQYNVAFYKWESMKVQVREMDEWLKEMEHVLPKLLADSTNAIKVIQSDIDAQRARLSAATTNIILRAPIDGVISVVNNRPGERIMAGTPVAIVTGTESERIIAYMRPPITFVPKPGDVMQVRRRTFQRQAATATVRDVGSQMEPISPALLAVTGAPKVDLGLPFAINMPPNLHLLPGEVVDIIVRKP